MLAQPETDIITGGSKILSEVETTANAILPPDPDKWKIILICGLAILVVSLIWMVV